MSVPVVGLSTYCEPARWGAWEAPVALLPASYIDQVTEAGGVPVLLPPVPGVATAIARLDALVLTGGGGVDPGHNGAGGGPRGGRGPPRRGQGGLGLDRAGPGARAPGAGSRRRREMPLAVRARDSRKAYGAR